MSRTTVSINKTKELLDGVSGLDCYVADVVENIEKLVKFQVDAIATVEEMKELKQIKQISNDKKLLDELKAETIDLFAEKLKLKLLKLLESARTPIRKGGTKHKRRNIKKGMIQSFKDAICVINETVKELEVNNNND